MLYDKVLVSNTIQLNVIKKIKKIKITREFLQSNWSVMFQTNIKLVFYNRTEMRCFATKLKGDILWQKSKGDTVQQNWSDLLQQNWSVIFYNKIEVMFYNNIEVWRFTT